MRPWLHCLVVLSVWPILLWPSRADAYTWMIRHGYQTCGQCHVDPSGGGPLTTYGRGLGELEMRSSWLVRRDEEAELGMLLGGLAKPPEELSIGGDLRLLAMRRKIEGTAAASDLIFMQADLNAAVTIERFVASASVGYADEGALGAALSRDAESNVVSRHHWLGAWLDDEHELLARGGRMNLPFGIRNLEHTLWARALTGTDINDDQQTGLSLAYATPEWRAELMGIYGNVQLRPADFRERGYSGYGEWFASDTLALGASSKLTHVDLDTRLLKETWRHAHGVFARWRTPFDPLIVLSEWDYVLQSSKDNLHKEGIVGYAQVDIEAAPGIHLIATGEAHNVGVEGPPFSFAGWFSYAWFLAPHADVRLDCIYQSIGTEIGAVEALVLLAQAHLYL